MKKGSKKSPIQHTPKTKEELEREMKLEAGRKLIIERFFPALKEATVSVDEATMLLGAACSLIMEEAMEALKTTKMDAVRNRIVKKLCPNDERLIQIENLIKIFDNQSLFEARGHFESMKACIEQMKMDEMRSRKLDTLKEDWDRYLVRK